MHVYATFECMFGVCKAQYRTMLIVRACVFIMMLEYYLCMENFNIYNFFLFRPCRISFLISIRSMLKNMNITRSVWVNLLFVFHM